MPLATPPIVALTPAQITQQQQQQIAQGEVPQAAQTLNAQIAGLPEYQAYMRAISSGSGIAPNAAPLRDALSQKLQTLHIPDALIFDPFTGQVRTKTWDERHSALSGLAYTGLAVGAGLAGGAALGAFAAPAAAAGASSAGAGGGLSGLGASAVAPEVIGPSAVAGPGIGAVTGAAGSTAAATGGAAATSGGLFKNLILPNAISAAENLIGAKIGANASQNAAAIQSASADKAIAEERAALAASQAYNQNQLGLAQGRNQPYIDAGGQALSRLGQGVTQPVTNPYAYNTPGSAPSGPSGPLSGLGTPSTGPSSAVPPSGPPMITIQAPTGQTKQVPASEAQHWISVGAKVIG